ncbi:hypothetical protein, partial [Neolewinella aurantiaca]|uniref:hypothetical protein n=1 Tax=Neolewinella aurantiaca TaxID=2602767 RepID=UPI001C9BE901
MSVPYSPRSNQPDLNEPIGSEATRQTPTRVLSILGFGNRIPRSAGGTALIFWFVFYQEKMNGQNRKKRSFRGEYIIFASLTSPCLPTA